MAAAVAAPYERVVYSIPIVARLITVEARRITINAPARPSARAVMRGPLRCSRVQTARMIAVKTGIKKDSAVASARLIFANA